MCGVLGWFSVKAAIPKKEVVEGLRLLKHRGPDGWGLVSLNPQYSFCGSWSELSETASFPQEAAGWLGHTRLAIIDLSPEAAQPM